MGKGRFWLYSFSGATSEWLVGVIWRGGILKIPRCCPIPQIKVVGNDGSQDGYREGTHM